MFPPRNYSSELPEYRALRSLIQRMITEASDVSAGEEYEAMEKSAKEKYEATLAALQAWEANEKRKAEFPQKLSALLKSKKISKDNARRELMADPTANYDVKLAQKKRATLEDDVRKAEEEYASFNPEIKQYQRTKKSGGAKTTAAKEMPPPGKRRLMDISTLVPLEWHVWPTDIAKKSGKPYGATSKDDASDRAAIGTGPGEDWLAYIFGGQVQGGGVSFDVVTPDGRAWEVKALEGPTDTVRPGTEGLKAFERPRKRLERVMNQMKAFASAALKADLKNSLTDVDIKIINYVSAFVEDEFEMMVSKGEIAKDRLIAFRSALRALNKFKQYHGQTKGENNPKVDTRVKLNDKEKVVDKTTFIDIARKVEKSTGDKDVLQDFEKFDILLATLKDPAFDDPKGFFDEWFESVDINKVFEQVDGCFIVNRKGFTMVPKSMFKRVFKFNKVTQGKPRFMFNAPWISSSEPVKSKKAA